DDGKLRGGWSDWKSWGALIQPKGWRCQAAMRGRQLRAQPNRQRSPPTTDEAPGEPGRGPICAFASGPSAAWRPGLVRAGGNKHRFTANFTKILGMIRNVPDLAWN